MWSFGHMGVFGLGWIFQFVFLALVVGGVFLLIGHKGEGCCGLKNQKKDEGDPIKILKTRYAKGEINREEFEKIKKDLE